MRWYISYPILAAGLAFGVDILFPGQPAVSRSSSGLHATRDAVLPSTDHPDELPTVVLATDIEFASRLSAFSPGARILPVETARVSVLDYLAQKLSPLDFTPSVTTPAVAQPASAPTWKSAVIREAEPIYQTALIQERVIQERVGDTSRDALARDIQRQLQRVGCYLGEIDGVWGGGSKRAMLMFMDRVNASLPTHDPDVFMLSLLRAQDGSVCGASCPQGQSHTSGGRCMPTTLVAQADRSSAGSLYRTASDVAIAEPEAAWAPIVTEASGVAEAPVLIRPPMPYGRMSIGGPKSAEDALAQPNTKQATMGPATTRPITADRLARVAALEAPASDQAQAVAPEDLPKLTKSSFDVAVAEPPVRRVKAAASTSRSKSAGRSSSRGGGNYRHVQRLFEHPLGRM
jgi:hypothetical protein